MSPAPRKLPTPGEMAAEIREGRTTDDLAIAYGVTTRSWIRQVLSDAGYSSITGQPLHNTALDPIGAYAMFDPRPWTEQALCATTDPESFFPEKGGSTREAKGTCLRCEVRAECLEYALANQERFGIWGGMSERERRRLTKAHAA